MQIASRAFGRAQIQFFGYPAKRLERALSRFDTDVRTDPAFYEFENVVFHPGKRCLYDASGRRIEASRLRWVDPDSVDTEGRRTKIRLRELKEEPETITLPADPIRVRKPHAYLGELKAHYGHFLTDGLSRAWLMDHIAPDTRVFFLRDGPQAVGAPHVTWFVEHAGLVDRMRVVARPLLFDRVICPVPALQQANRIYGNFDAPHRRAAGLAIAASGLTPPNRPIYISRRELGPGYRDIRREDELEARLEREGYLIIHPGRLTIDEQVMAFNQDQPVIALMGSALHTLLFRISDGAPKIGAVTPDDIPGRFVLIDMIKGSASLYINGLIETTEAPDPGALALNERTWSIDVDLVMAALDGAGFFDSRKRLNHQATE